MTTAFQLEYGRDEIGILREQVRDRSTEALHLPLATLALFRGVSAGAYLRLLLVGLVYAPADGGLTLAQLSDLVIAMSTGVNCMPVKDLSELVVYLRADPAPITATEVNALLRAIVTHPDAPITPLEATRTILALGTSIRPRHVHSLFMVALGNVNNRAIAPSYLRDVVAAPPVVPAFPASLATAIAQPEGLAHSRQLIARMVASPLPAQFVPELFVALNIIAIPRFDKMTSFLTFAQAAVNALPTWEVRIMRPLRKFISAERSPFGANIPFPNNGFVNAPVAPMKAMTGGQLCIPETHVNYFCNAHTFAHCNFTNRIAAGTAIDFWGPEFQKINVRNLLNAYTVGQLQPIATASDGQARYAMQRIGPTEIGVTQRRHHGVRFYTIDHCAPDFATHRIAQDALRAIAKLF